jgi:hypothetical protein
MHGYDDKPYLCTVAGCERGMVGNGFPRQWNVRDHLRRCHGVESRRASSSPEREPATERGEKRRRPVKEDGWMMVPKI